MKLGWRRGRRRVEGAELDRILEEHRRYLDGEPGGTRADLSGADLTGLDLADVRLDHAELTDGDLSRANLSGGSLRGATMRGAVLQRTVLDGTNLREAEVAGADLRDAVLCKDQILSSKSWLRARWPFVLIAELGYADQDNRVGRDDFSGYDLTGKDLSSSDLRGVSMDGALMKGCLLKRTDLQDSSLQGVDLSTTHDLRAYQLRGADLTQATLPAGLAETFKSIPQVDEATKAARDLFLVLMAALLYCWLTMLSTTDVTLVAGNSTLALPIVSTPIPITAFFWWDRC